MTIQDHIDELRARMARELDNYNITDQMTDELVEVEHILLGGFDDYANCIEGGFLEEFEKDLKADILDALRERNFDFADLSAINKMRFLCDLLGLPYTVTTTDVVNAVADCMLALSLDEAAALLEPKKEVRTKSLDELTEILRVKRHEYFKIPRKVRETSAEADEKLREIVELREELKWLGREC